MKNTVGSIKPSQININHVFMLRKYFSHQLSAVLSQYQTQ